MSSKLSFALLWAASVFAQPALKFEVATIKLADPNATVRNQMLRAAPNRISIPSMTLSWLIYTAYGEGMNTSATVTGGPDWMNLTAYAVEGLAHEPATQRQCPAPRLADPALPPTTHNRHCSRQSGNSGD